MSSACRGERRSAGRLIGYLSLDPTQPGWQDELRHGHQDLGLRGIKLMPMYAGFDPAAEAYEPLYAYAERHGLPLLVHTGTTFVSQAPLEYAMPRHLDPVAIRHPELRIVLAHLGHHPFEGECIAVIRKHLGAGQDTGAVDDEYTGSHPVAYEYAVDCDVSGIQATGTFWPVIMRRWCTRYRTVQCGLKNPPTVMYGGAGYLTQQIYCLYGHVADCTSSNVRHLNDLTASAYCQVVNCHGDGDGDDEGGNPFTTHGQYEHDLLFDGNSGLMDIANSGIQWGNSAKRITVRNHVCSWFTANTRITDLTLENVKVIARPTFDAAGTLVVNADGAQLRGCTASFFVVAQPSARSHRPTTVTDCSFDLPKPSVLVQTPVTAAVHFVRTTLTGCDGTILRGAGAVHFTDCHLSGGPGAAPLSVGAAEVTVDGGSLTGTGIALSAVRDQRIGVGGGTVLSGTNTAGALLSRATGTTATVTWDLADLRSTAADADTAHLRIGDGRNRYTAVGARSTGGRLALSAAAFGRTSSLLHTACTEDGVVRDGLPPDGERVSATTGNLTL